jgi:hypothetical protein
MSAFKCTSLPPIVMAGRVPAIHDLTFGNAMLE